MTDPRPVPLGVGTLVSQTFSLAVASALPLLAVAAIPSLVNLSLGAIFFGSLAATLALDTLVMPEPWQVFALPAVWGLAAVLVSGVLALSTYLRATGRGASVGGSFGATLTVVPFLVVVNIVVALLGLVGALFLLLPGLYIFALYFCAVHAVVIERRGLGAFGRAAALTRGYRWPIMGAIVLVAVIMFLLQLLFPTIPVLVLFPVDQLTGAAAPGTAAMLAVSALNVLSGAVNLLVFACLATQVYIRLRHIKEGTGTEDVARIFE